MASGTNRLRIRGEFDDRASKQVKGLRGEFDKIGKSEGARTILQGVGMGAGISAFSLLGDAIGFATNQAMESIRAASDLSETMSKAEVIFGDNAEAVQTWGDTMAEAAGLSKRAALDAASGFAGLFKTVGLELDQATEMSTKLTQLGSDLASFFNTDVESALAALKSGLNGESEPLRRFNVFLSESAVAAEAMRIGISKTGKGLTEAQKATARYSLILGQTGDAQGDYARTSDGLANSQRTLAAEIENLQAAIGEDLLPIARDLANWAKDEGVPALRDLIAVVREAGPVVEMLGFLFDHTTAAQVQYKRAVEETTEAQKRDAAGQQRWAHDVRVSRGNLELLAESQLAAGDAMAQASMIASSARPKYLRLGRAVGYSADQMDRLKDKTDDALEAMLEAAFGPAELRRQLKSLAFDQKQNTKEQERLQDKIDKFKDAGKPVGRLRDEMRDLRDEAAENTKEIARANTRLFEMGEITFGALVRNLEDVGIVLDRNNTLAASLYGYLEGIRGSRRRPGRHQAANPGSDDPGAASGGFRPAGWTGRVGELGEERMFLLPGGGAVISPNAGGGGHGGAVPVEIPIRIDGREVARVVDKHLYYEAARAPHG